MARASLLSRSANGKGPNLLARHDQSARTLRIDDFEITDSGDCYVIAEIGHNHQGLGREGAQALRRGQGLRARTR